MIKHYKRADYGFRKQLSILTVLIIVSGLAVLHTAVSKLPHCGIPASQHGITITDNHAISSGNICSSCFRKSWIPNKDNFRILSFNEFEFLQNRKTDLIIELSKGNPVNGFLYTHLKAFRRLFPHERDEIPVLS